MNSQLLLWSWKVADCSLEDNLIAKKCQHFNWMKSKCWQDKFLCYQVVYVQENSQQLSRIIFALHAVLGSSHSPGAHRESIAQRVVVQVHIHMNIIINTHDLGVLQKGDPTQDLVLH